MRDHSRAEHTVRFERLAVLAVANTVALVFLLLAVVSGVAAAVFVALRSIAGGGPGLPLVAELGVLIIVAPIGLAVVAWMVTAAICLSYNVVARATGGVSARMTEGDPR